MKYYHYKFNAVINYNLIFRACIISEEWKKVSDKLATVSLPLIFIFRK